MNNNHNKKLPNHNDPVLELSPFGNNEYADFFAAARRVCLSPEEKRAGLQALKDHLHARQTRHISTFFLQYRSIILTGAAMVVIFMAGSLISAAANALPGDFAYSVKTAVNEPVAVLFATTPQARAEVETSQASARLEEAEKLALRGKLTADMQEKLHQNFEAHTANAIANINTLAGHGDIFAAAMLGSDFESVLASHHEILSHIPTANSTVAESVTSISVDVTLALSNATEVRTSAESALATSSDPSLIRTAAEKAANIVGSALKEASTAVSSLGISRADAAVQSSAEAQLNTAQNYQSEAASKLKAGAYGDAVVLFGKAHRAAQVSVLEVRTAREVNLVGSMNPGTANSTETTSE